MTASRAASAAIPFIAALAAVPLCMAVADRPFARWAHDAVPAGGGPHAAFVGLTHIVDPLYAVAGIFVAAGLLLALAGRPVEAIGTPLAASVSLAMAHLLGEGLKLAFGRTWPETWTNHNPSFIADGVFTFAPFHGGAGWASFPSGHMVTITSVVGVLAVRWPQLRPLWIGLAVLVAIGLLGADYHFVSDVIAGSVLGSAVALGTARLLDPGRSGPQT